MTYADYDQIYATNDQDQLNLLDKKAYHMRSVYKKRSTDYRIVETDTTVEEEEI